MSQHFCKRGSELFQRARCQLRTGWEPSLNCNDALAAHDRSFRMLFQVSLPRHCDGNLLVALATLPANATRDKNTSITFPTANEYFLLW
jgi:hypothetical protein